MKESDRSSNIYMNKYEPYATANKVSEDLAPELSVTEAAKITRIFLRSLPDDLVDVDIGLGF
jgi:hypothetical protein